MSAIVLAVIVAACVGDGASNPTAQNSVTTQVPASPQSETSAPAVGMASELVGAYGARASDTHWPVGYLELDADGTARWRGLDVGPGPWEPLTVELSVASNADVLDVVGDGPWDCEGQLGRYTWSLTGDTLQLGAADEPCGRRAKSLVDGVWRRLDPASIVDTEALDLPVVVESPFGAIEWVQIGMSDELGELTAVDEGFVAVVAVEPDLPERSELDAVDGSPEPQSASERLESGRLIASSDGLVWEELDVSWSPPPMLAAADGRLYAVGAGVDDGQHAPAVSVSSDGGRSWEAISLPTLPGDRRVTEQFFPWDVSAGGAGLAISAVATSGAGTEDIHMVWVGDGTTFEVLDTTFAGLDPGAFGLKVFVLDSGFVAVARREYARVTLWRSTDGRVWEPIEVVPDDQRTAGFDNDIVVYSIDGDTIVLAASASGLAATSDDAGATWHYEPMVQPLLDDGHALRFDRGHLVVDMGHFCPAAGAVWASVDGRRWHRVLNPWPPPDYMFEPVMSGDVIVIPSVLDADVDGLTLWVGTLLN